MQPTEYLQLIHVALCISDKYFNHLFQLSKFVLFSVKTLIFDL